MTSIGSCRCSSTRIGRRHSGSMRRRSPGSKRALQGIAKLFDVFPYETAQRR